MMSQNINLKFNMCPKPADEIGSTDTKNFKLVAGIVLPTHNKNRIGRTNTKVPTKTKRHLADEPHCHVFSGGTAVRFDRVQGSGEPISRSNWCYPEQNFNVLYDVWRAGIDNYQSKKSDELIKEQGGFMGLEYGGGWNSERVGPELVSYHRTDLARLRSLTSLNDAPDAETRRAMARLGLNPSLPLYWSSSREFLFTFKQSKTPESQQDLYAQFDYEGSTVDCLLILAPSAMAMISQTSQGSVWANPTDRGMKPGLEFGIFMKPKSYIDMNIVASQFIRHLIRTYSSAGQYQDQLPLVELNPRRIFQVADEPMELVT
jgi:hypothetical protein